MKSCIFILLIGVYSCTSSTNSITKEKVIEYKSNVLYVDDITKILPQNYTKEDSIQITEAYIKKWLQKKITVENAKRNTSAQELKELEQQIEEYRDDLLLNKFYNQKLEKLNENAISEQEIQSYYQQNQESFILNQDIAIANYIIASEDDKETLQKALQSSKTIEEICQDINIEVECYTENQWIPVEQLMQQLGITPQDVQKLKNKQTILTTINNKISFVTFLEYKNKTQVAPLEYYKNTIKSILINKRKLNLQQQMEDSLYQQEIKNNTIKYHYNS